MKILFAALTALALSTMPARTLSAEIPWQTFTGGGGIAQYGSRALGGAIGPIVPAFSPATGSNYTLTAGFWPAFVGQPQPASPLLKVQSLADGSKVQLSWPVTLNGFVLEYSTNIHAGTWSVEESTVVDTATEHTVTVPPIPLFRCYRLRGL